MVCHRHRQGPELQIGKEHRRHPHHAQNNAHHHLAKTAAATLFRHYDPLLVQLLPGAPTEPPRMF